MEKTNEATPNSTPRPWNLYRGADGYMYIESAKVIVARCYGWEMQTAVANAELIVKAVNAYDALIEENQKLKNDLLDALDLKNGGMKNSALGMLQAENQKLREALKARMDSLEDYNSEYFFLESLLKNASDNLCSFCGWRKEDHHGVSLLCYHYSDEDSDHFYKDRTFKAKNV